MARTILTASRGNQGSTGVLAAGSTNYFRVANSSLTPETVQNRAEVTWHTPGVFSKLYVRVLANATIAPSTIHLRVNGFNVASTVTITAGFIGVIEDTTHSDTIADGDEVVYTVVTGAGGSLTLSLISIIFNATTDCASKQVNHAYGLSAASATQFIPISGRLSGATATESATESTVKKAGVARNAFVFISGNARITNTTLTLRKNRVDTAIVLTATPGFVGILEDTTNSISFAPDDELNWKLTTGTGTEGISFHSLALDYITTQGEGFINANCTGVSADIVIGPGVTEYYVVGGAMIQATTTEANAEMTAREAFSMSNLTVNVRGNSLTATSTVTLRKNGADTAMTVSIDSGVLGFFVDTTNIVTFAAGDTMSYKVVTGATGTTLTIRQMAIWSVLTAAPIIGTGGGTQGRSPLYRQVRRREPEIAIAIVRVRIPLEYEVEKLSVQVKLPLLVPQKPVIKYASAVLSVIEHILPLPMKPTPPPPQIRIVRVSIPLTYEVTNLQLKAACSYQVDRLFTRQEQHKIAATSINFLLSDFI